MIIYTSKNAVQQQTYGTNQFRINNLLADEYIRQSITKGSSRKDEYPKVWGTRDNVIDTNFKILFSDDKFTRQDFEGVLYSNGVEGIYAEDIAQVSKSIDSWFAWDEIKNGVRDGAVITVDTETYGDILGNGKNTNGIFGISEIGISRTTYKDGHIYLGEASGVAEKIAGTSLGSNSIVDMNVLDKGYSETVVLGGADKQQIEYLNSIVRKWDSKTWSSLTPDEQIIMKRASVYAHAEIGESKVFKGLFAIKGTQAQTIDIDAAKLGIKFFEETGKAYASDNISQADAIFRVLHESGVINGRGTLSKGIKNRTDVLNFANSRFDLNAFANVLEASGNKRYIKTAETLRNASSYVADTTYLIRAVAATNNMSVDQLLRSKGFKGGGAGMESLLGSMFYTMEQMHTGGSDASNQRFVSNSFLDSLSGKDLSRLKLDENGVPLALQRTNRDTIYFMKNGVFDKSEGLEFAAINGQPTQNYSFRGQFWSLDESKTGWADMQIATDSNGGRKEARKFVVTLTDQADLINGVKNPTTITLSANTPEELGDRLGRNMIAYNKNELTDYLITSQKIEAQTDLGRRAWDRFINTTDTAYEYSNGTIKAINGFQGLKDTISLIDQLGINEGDYNTATGVSDILAIAKEKGIKLRPSDAQELAALTGKINNERPMLDKVISAIEEGVSVDQGNEAIGNFTRTHVLNNTLKEIYEAAGVQDVQTLRNVYDKYGIDMRVSNDLIARIDAQSTKNAARDINRMINKHMMSGQYVDKHKLGTAVGDLVSRGVITRDMAKSLNISKLDQSNIYNSFTVPLAQALYENNLKMGGVVKPIGGELESSRILMYDDVPFYQKFKDVYSHIITSDGTELQYPSYIDESLVGKMDSIVAKNIATAPKIAPLASSPMADRHDKFDEAINQIADALGIHNQKDKNLVYSMFFSTDKETNKMKDYAIGKYIDEDVAFSIITNDSGNRAYVAVSKGNDMQKFLQQISTGDYDLSSYNRLTSNKDIFKYAAIMELPFINEYKVRETEGPLGVGTLRTATLGDSHEIMLTPEMRTVIKDTGAGEKVSVYLNSGTYNLLSGYRVRGNAFMGNVNERKYELASKLINNEKVSRLMDLPGSASAAAMYDPVAKKIVRQISLTSTDIMYADALKIGDAIRNNENIGDALDVLFEKAIKTENPDLMSVINEFIQNRGIGDIVYRKNIKGVLQSDSDYFIDVFRNSRTGLQEYFAKHKFQNFNADNVLNTLGDEKLLNKNFFDLIEESIAKNDPRTSKITFDNSVTESLKTFRSLFPNGDVTRADLLRSVGFYQAHMVGTSGVTSAFYNLGASSSNIIRPTYGQMNNPVRFNLQDAIADFAPLNDSKYSFFRASAGNIMYNANLEEAYNVLTSTSKKANRIISGTDTDFLTVIQNTNDLNIAQKVSAMDRFTKAERHELFKDIVGNTNMLEDDDKWKKGLKYFASQLSSFEEGSAVIHPYLMNSRAMSLTEGTNLEMPIDKMDIGLTRKRLSDIVAKGKEKGYGYIKKGDVLGFMNDGTAWYYTGNDAYIDATNINELIPEGVETVDNLAEYSNYGKTKIAEAGAGDFSVRKVLLGGNEKTIVRSVSGKEWARAAGYSQREKDLEIANKIVARMFDYVSDGATIMANLNIEKHGANFFMQNKWNMLTSTLSNRGELDDLYNLIESTYKKEITPYGTGGAGFTVRGIRIMKPSLNGGRWLMDDSAAENASAFIDDVFNTAMSSKNAVNGLKAEAIDAISAMNRYFTDHNMVMIRTQRQHINPFMGNFMRINSRVEQAMYLLGQGVGNAEETAEILAQNREYMRLMREYATTYNARSTASQSGAFGSVLNAISEGVNRERISATTDLIDKRATRAIGGLLGVLEDATSDGTDNIMKYASISVDDLIENEKRIASAMSDETILQNAPVLVNGRRTEYLNSILGNNSDQMLRLNLGTNITYTMDGKQYTRDSVLIPIHDIRTKISSDKYTMALDQKATSKFLSTVRNIKMNPNGKNVGERISEAYMAYLGEITKELARDDKNSTLFKYANSYMMPTSIQVMAESEASALTESLANNKAFIDAVNDEQRIAKQLAENGIPKDVSIDEITNIAKDYAKVITTKTKLMDEAATKIEEGAFDALAVPTNDFIKSAMTRIDEKGVKHYGMVAAMSQSAFEDIGLSMNAISFDIIRDYEAERFGNIAKANVPDVATMFGSSNKMSALDYTKFKIASERGNIIDRMNAVLKQSGYDNLLLRKDQSLIAQLNDVTNEILKTPKGRKSGASFDKYITKSLNRHIAEHGPENVIFNLVNAFTDSQGNSLGTEYLQRVGIYAQLIRQPVFSSQPLSRIFLDKGMDGMGRTIRLFNPLYTSKMHVDFDGDTMFISAMLDGNSVLKSNTKKYETLVKLYNTYVDKFSNAGVAEHVREGAYAKTNLLYSEKAQRASLLQLINEKEYNEAVNKFKGSDAYKSVKESLEKEVKAESISQDTMDTVLKAFTAHSDEVSDAFNNTAINFATDPSMIVASIAAKERNLYIGQASTPNFKLRDTLIAVFNTSQDKEMKERVAELLNDFTNTGSTTGGLLTILEQKMIDTKKAIDALNISEIGLYTLGIEQIKNSGAAKDSKAAFARGLRNVMRGSGPNVYSFLREENAEQQIDTYVRFAKDLNYEDIKKVIEEVNSKGSATVGEAYFDKNNIDILNHIKAYKNLADIYADKQNAATIAYFDLYAKSGNKFVDSITGTLKMYREFAEKAGIEEGFVGTSLEKPMYETREILLRRQRELEKITSFSSEDILENRLYFIPNADKGWGRIPLVTAKGEAQEWLDDVGPGFIARDENNRLVTVSLGLNDSNPYLTNRVIDERKLTREQLNLIAQSEPSDLGAFLNNDNGEIARQYNRLVDKEISDVLDVFAEKGKSDALSYKANDRVANAIKLIENTDDTRLKEMMDAFDSIIADNPNAKAVLRYNTSSMNLMKHMNSQIASTVRNMSDPGADPDYLINKVRGLMINSLKAISNNSEQLFNEALAKSHVFGGSTSEISNAIEYLRRNVYNVEAEEAQLNTKYIELESLIDGLNKSPKVKQEIIQDLQNIYDSKADTIAEALTKIRTGNEKIVQDTQNLVYKLIQDKGTGNFSDDLSVLFEFTNPNMNSKVAFGELMGLRFGNLGSDDVKTILSTSTEGLGEYETQAINATKQALEAYKKLNPVIKNGTGYLSNIGNSDITLSISNSIDEAVQASQKASGLSTEELVSAYGIVNAEKRDAARQAAKMNKKTLGSMVFNKKTVGTVLGALAAIGIVNKIVHGKDNDSPLVPSKSSDSQQGNEPSYDAPGTPKGLQGGNNIYVDEKRGINFKISAKTKSKMLAMNAATATNNYGQGRGSLRIHADNSKINSNWLQNRFAELSE